MLNFQIWKEFQKDNASYRVSLLFFSLSPYMLGNNFWYLHSRKMKLFTLSVRSIWLSEMIMRRCCCLAFIWNTRWISFSMVFISDWWQMARTSKTGTNQTRRGVCSETQEISGGLWRACPESLPVALSYFQCDLLVLLHVLLLLIWYDMHDT